jgi:hypothetical protein
MISVSICLYFTVITDKSTIGGLFSFLHIPNFIMPFLAIAISQLCGVAITATTNIKTRNEKIVLKIDLVHTYTKMKHQLNMNVNV